MHLVELIHTTPAVQKAARELAPQLRELDVIRLLTKDERVNWFRYQRLEPWENECLIKELQKMANDIKLVIEKHAGATLQERRPHEKRPLPTIERLDVGWVKVPTGYVVFLVSVAAEDCAEASVEAREGLENDSHQSVPKFLCGSGLVVFGPASYRTEPAGIPYASVLLPASPLGRREE